MPLLADAADAVASPWAEFGLTGLVIGALFAAIVVIVRGGLIHVDKIHTSHREERKEWRDDIAARQAQTDNVIKDLTSAIRDSHRQ